MTDLSRWRAAVWLACAVAALSAVAGCRFRGHRRAPTTAESLRAIETEPWGQPDAVLVEVNGRPITRGEFYVRVLRRYGTAQTLSGLVKEELFLQEAERLGVKVEPEEIDRRVEEVFAEQRKRAGGLEQLEAEYRQLGLTLVSVREDVRRDVATQLLIGEVTKALREIDDEVILQYYKRTYGQRRYMTRQIAYSYLTEPGEPAGTLERRKLEARTKALRAVARLREGADFETLARAESEDPVTARKGGWLGPVTEQTEMTVPALKQAILQLGPGDVSEPIESPGRGYHVFQVTEIRASESFADCREKIIEELKTMEPEMREITAALEKLEERSTVKMFDVPFVRTRPVPEPIRLPPETPGEDTAVQSETPVGTETPVSEEPGG